jgi:hypothetical protein
MESAESRVSCLEIYGATAGSHVHILWHNRFKQIVTPVSCFQYCPGVGERVADENVWIGDGFCVKGLGNCIVRSFIACALCHVQ